MTNFLKNSAFIWILFSFLWIWPVWNSQWANSWIWQPWGVVWERSVIIWVRKNVCLCTHWLIEWFKFISFLYSEPRIVALITVCANTGVQGLTYARSATFVHVYVYIFYLAQANIRALIFSKFLQLKNWVNLLNMQRKFWYKHFWLWRPQSLTHTPYGNKFRRQKMVKIEINNNYKNVSKIILSRSNKIVFFNSLS